MRGGRISHLLAINSIYGASLLPSLSHLCLELWLGLGLQAGLIVELGQGEGL